MLSSVTGRKLVDGLYQNKLVVGMGCSKKNGVDGLFQEKQISGWGWAVLEQNLVSGWAVP